jgi:hypothetical protein
MQDARVLETRLGATMPDLDQAAVATGRLNKPSAPSFSKTVDNPA